MGNTITKLRNGKALQRSFRLDDREWVVELDDQGLRIRRKHHHGWQCAMSWREIMAKPTHCQRHADDASNFNGCVYCERQKTIDYAANLQRFLTYLIEGREPPQFVLDACPHHADMYARAVGPVPE